MQKDLNREGWRELALALHADGLSWRAIARELDLPKSTVSDYLRQAAEPKEKTQERKENPAKILIFDVEVSASVVLAFGRWKVNLSPKHVLQEPYMLTWSAKWLGEDTLISLALPDYPIFYVDASDDYNLIRELWDLVNQADIVVAHNLPFDMGWLNQRAAYHGLNPPKPVKWIDTLREIKKNFSLPQNSLDGSTKYFEIRNKLDNEGITLWKRCMEGEVDAFREMQVYNEGDVLALEALYLKIRPWIMQHPNVSVFGENAAPACVCCGSERLEKMDGYAYTAISQFEIFRCLGCGKINRNRTNAKSKEQMQNILTNAMK